MPVSSTSDGNASPESACDPTINEPSLNDTGECFLILMLIENESASFENPSPGHIHSYPS